MTDLARTLHLLEALELHLLSGRELAQLVVTSSNWSAAKTSIIEVRVVHNLRQGVRSGRKVERHEHAAHAIGIVRGQTPLHALLAPGE